VTACRVTSASSATRPSSVDQFQSVGTPGTWNASRNGVMFSLKAAWLDAEDADEQVAIDHEISERIGREIEAEFQLAARVLRGAAAQSRAYASWASDKDPEGAKEANAEAEGLVAVAALLESRGGAQ